MTVALIYHGSPYASATTNPAMATSERDPVAQSNSVTMNSSGDGPGHAVRLMDPVFALCMGRSGSTLLRLTLDPHQDWPAHRRRASWCCARNWLSDQFRLAVRAIPRRRAPNGWRGFAYWLVALWAIPKASWDNY